MVARPTITRRTIARRVNLERLRANAVEAAEQSERLSVPEIREPVDLDALLRAWPRDRKLVFCDEGGDAAGRLAGERGERLFDEAQGADAGGAQQQTGGELAGAAQMLDQHLDLATGILHAKKPRIQHARVVEHHHIARIH